MDYRTMDDVELSILINQAKGLPRNHALSKFYASDMNAAVALLREMGGRLWWDSFGNVWAVTQQQDTYTHPENPARAVSEAWLQWRDGHG